MTDTGSGSGFRWIIGAAAGVLVLGAIVGGAIYAYNRATPPDTRASIADTVREELEKAGLKRPAATTTPATAPADVATIVREEIAKALAKTPTTEPRTRAPETTPERREPTPTPTTVVREPPPGGCTATNSGPRPKGEGWVATWHPGKLQCDWFHPGKVAVTF